MNRTHSRDGITLDQVYALIDECLLSTCPSVKSLLKQIETHLESKMDHNPQQFRSNDNDSSSERQECV